VLPGQDAALQLERGIEQLAQAEKVAGKVRGFCKKRVLVRLFCVKRQHTGTSKNN